MYFQKYEYAPANLLSRMGTVKVIYMNGMFGSALVFNQPIGNWNTAKVRGKESPLYSEGAFN